MQNKTIAIHQPNFFPWLGYFSKIIRADHFVYLDHVRSNTIQTLIKRVTIIVASQSQWLTIPLKKGHADFPQIKEMEIDNTTPFSQKQLKTIELNYKKAPYFNEVMQLVQNYYASEEKLIAVRNIAFIEAVCAKLHIHTPRIRSSELDCRRTSNEMLIEITKKLGGNRYMCGGGSADYQDDDKFKEANIEVVYQNFEHPIYPQFNAEKFIPGLSIIDALMNIGFKGVKELLISTSKSAIN
ncbi:MAG TPA: WbqC family protein [Chitinophagales bacterium]|nr:WbqC family protein [Chitinophagales bacterium]